MAPLDTQPDWRAELAEHEAEIAGDEPPFAIGQRVGFRSHPEHGSLVVTSVERYPRGGWRIGAGCDGYQAFADAGAFMAWPDGLAEPPQPPFGGSPDGASYEAFERKRLADLDDPAHAAAVSLWAERMRDWVRDLGRRS